MIRLLIADDHVSMRECLKEMFADVPDIVVSAEARDGIEVLEKLTHHTVDLVVLDVSMPRRDGIETLVDIKREYPTLPVLMLSMHAAEQYATRLLRAGAAGYMTKASAPDDLLKAIRNIVSARQTAGIAAS